MASEVSGLRSLDSRPRPFAYASAIITFRFCLRVENFGHGAVGRSCTFGKILAPLGGRIVNDSPNCLTISCGLLLSEAEGAAWQWPLAHGASRLRVRPCRRLKGASFRTRGSRRWPRTRFRASQRTGRARCKRDGRRGWGSGRGHLPAPLAHRSPRKDFPNGLLCLRDQTARHVVGCRLATLISKGVAGMGYESLHYPLIRQSGAQSNTLYQTPCYVASNLIVISVSDKRTI